MVRIAAADGVVGQTAVPVAPFALDGAAGALYTLVDSVTLLLLLLPRWA